MQNVLERSVIWWGVSINWERNGYLNMKVRVKNECNGKEETLLNLQRGKNKSPLNQFKRWQP